MRQKRHLETISNHAVKRQFVANTSHQEFCLFLKLPNELQVLVASFLVRRDLLNLACASKDLHSLLNETRMFWARFRPEHTARRGVSIDVALPVLLSHTRWTSSLTELDLSLLPSISCDAVTEVFLRHYSSLKIVRLPSVTRSVLPFDRLTKLETLCAPSSIVRDLVPLPSLQRLSLYDLNDWYDYGVELAPHNAQFTSLVSLDMVLEYRDNDDEFFDSGALGTLTQLTSLRLLFNSDTIAFYSNLNWLSGLHELRTLAVSGDENARFLTCLDSPVLRYLSIKCPYEGSVVAVSHLTRMQSLCELRIDAPVVDEIWLLHQLTGLTFLHLSFHAYPRGWHDFRLANFPVLRTMSMQVIARCIDLPYTLAEHPCPSLRKFILRSPHQYVITPYHLSVLSCLKKVKMISDFELEDTLEPYSDRVVLLSLPLGIIVTPEGSKNGYSRHRLSVGNIRIHCRHQLIMTYKDYDIPELPGPLTLQDLEVLCDKPPADDPPPC
eukprot:TRINITY_DN10282_c0_g1_i1.p1 TRINITY_DN10282_c0_g1~~TRINITY_DN10282_c0_g1_i1.p1  ORF type:complete len:495 (-),score=78.67 TRINITY_DN10282_c0_g1_i1:226-1710(-)